MMKTFSADEIKVRLQEKIQAKKAILVGSVGAGISAKVEMMAGVDILLACSEGRFRMDGHASSMSLLANGDCNGTTMSLAVELSKTCHDVPVLVGVGCSDPHRDIRLLMDSYQALGISGVANTPSVGNLAGSMFRKTMDEVAKLGVPAERAFLQEQRANGLFTLGFSYTEEDVSPMAACCDMICLDLGFTSGGIQGIRDVPSLDCAAQTLDKWEKLAKEANPDVICVCHGGPIETAADLQYILDRTDVKGFVGGSSLERLPIEQVILSEVSMLQALRTHRRVQGGKTA